MFFMFRVRAENVNREFHYANAAKRFAQDAKMLRCRAAVHVENKDDVVFWNTILNRKISFILFLVHEMNMGMKRQE